MSGSKPPATQTQTHIHRDITQTHIHRDMTETNKEERERVSRWHKAQERRIHTRLREGIRMDVQHAFW